MSNVLLREKNKPLSTQTNKNSKLVILCNCYVGADYIKINKTTKVEI